VIARIPRRAFRQVQHVLFATAFLTLGYCGFVQTESWVFQNRAGRELELLSEPSKRGLPAAALMGLIGRIEIPRLDVSVVVMEGSTDAILRHAAGHITGTSMPGQPGNVGISAHRDTFFRPLQNIRRNDIIALTTLAGSFRYRVVSTSIVLPTDVSVLNSGNGEILTLVTCYPFYYVGSAPSRFIVRAERTI
jgi:sortase A